MPKDIGIELSLYVDKDVKSGIELLATKQRRSRSWIGNELLKASLNPKDELDPAVRRNLESRARDLNMTQGQMMNVLLRESLGMVPVMENSRE